MTKIVAIIDRGSENTVNRYRVVTLDGTKISSSNMLRIVLDDVREYFKDKEDDENDI